MRWLAAAAHTTNDRRIKTTKGDIFRGQTLKGFENTQTQVMHPHDAYL